MDNWSVAAASGSPSQPAEVGWPALPLRARAFRVVHAAWSVAGLASVASIWAAAVRRSRGRGLVAAVAFVLLEGAGLVVGRGNCPMAGQQAEWGDPVPFFELVLPPRAAKAAVPILALVTIAGLIAVALRGPTPKTWRS